MAESDKKTAVVVSARYSWVPQLLLSGILAGILSLAGHAQTPPSAPADKSSRAVLYAAAGAELTQYDVDAEGASLVKRRARMC